MIFKSDNYDELSLTVGLFPWISIPLFWGVFTADGVTSKIVCGMVGSFFAIGPIILFSWNRYEVKFEDDGIKVNFTNRKRKNLVFPYHELTTIILGPKNNVAFTFQLSSGKKKSYMVFNQIKDLSAFILYTRLKNDNVHYKVNEFDNDVYTFVKRELKKKLPTI